MSSTAVAQPQGSSRRDDAWSAPARLVAALSGTPALVIKIVLLAVVNAVARLRGDVARDNNRWPAFVFALLATLLIDVVYLSRIQALVPLKFLLPGTLFLIAFQIVPIIYNVNVAFTNYSTGHLFSKGEAITAIKAQTLEQPGERQDVHDGAGPEGRPARADPQGRRDRPVLRRLEGRAHAAAEPATSPRASG